MLSFCALHRLHSFIDFRFAQENDLIFLETSAKTGESVEEAFLKCSKTILAKIETGELDPERIGSGIQYGEALGTRRAGGGLGGSPGGRQRPDCTNVPCKF